MISKILVGRKTSEVVENADEPGFGEGQVSAKLEITSVPAASAEPVGDQTASSYADEKELSLAATAANSGHHCEEE